MLAHLAPAAEWQQGPSLPDPRWHHAAGASPDGHVFAFGGRLRVGPKRVYEHGTGDFAIDVYDPTKNRWSRGPTVAMRTSRAVDHYYRKVRVEGTRELRRVPVAKERVVRSNKLPYELPFGGADRVGRAHYFSSSGATFFDPGSGTWGHQVFPVFHSESRTGKRWVEGGTVPMWDRSAGATATGPDGRMYLVGGLGKRKYSGEGWLKDRVLGALEIYDPGTEQWLEAAPMKVARQQLGAAFGPDGKLYVFGGCACRGSTAYKVGDEAAKQRALAEGEAMKHPVAMSEVYDPTTDTWSDRAPIPTPRMSVSAAAGRDGKIYVIGGQDRWAGDPLHTVEMYDPAADTWTTGPSLRIGRVAHASAVTPDGRIWVIGGSGTAPGLGDVWRLLRGESGGPQRTVEVLDTAPSND